MGDFCDEMLRLSGSGKKEKLYFGIIKEKVKLEKVAVSKNFIKVKGLWMEISERDLNYVKKHYNIGDFITIDYRHYDNGFCYVITKVYKKRKKKSIKTPTYKIFNNIILSYGGYCGSVISSEVGIAFGFKKMERETAEVEIKVKKGEIVIRRKK